MTDNEREQRDMKMTDIDAHRKGGDVPHDRQRDVSRDRDRAAREFGPTSFAADEEEQTRERERVFEGDHTDEIGEPTETEIDEDF